MPDKPKPLKELLEEQINNPNWVGYAEMARRVRVLDKFLATARKKGGVWVSATTVRRIVNGEQP